MNDLTPAEIEALARLMGNPFNSDTLPKESSTQQEQKFLQTEPTKTTVSKAQFLQLEEEKPAQPQSKQENDSFSSVQVKIEVVLGRTKMPIKSLLQLHEGSVLPLDKLAGEPVEILANGTKIALGEVVIINHNFGVKILRIAE